MTTLELYRDDGPLARAIGSLARGISSSLLTVVAVVPMFVLIAVKGDAASHAAVAAVLGWLVVLGAAASGTPPTDSFRWIVSPLLRAAEYAGLLWIGALAGGHAQPAAFALVCALTFR